MRHSMPLGDYMPLAAPLNWMRVQNRAMPELPSTYQQIELINLSDAVQCIDKFTSLSILSLLSLTATRSRSDALPLSPLSPFMLAFFVSARLFCLSCARALDSSFLRTFVYRERLFQNLLTRFLHLAYVSYGSLCEINETRTYNYLC